VVAGREHLIAVGEVFGEVERLDPATGEVVDRYEGFEIPHDVLEAANGDLIVAETGSGRVLRVSGPAPGQRSVVAAELAEPNGLAWAGDDAIYVTETEAGRLLRIELGSGASEVIAENLAQPEGVAVDGQGQAFVVEVGARRLTRIAENGRQRVVAEDLPIGLSNGPSLYRGIAVSEDGDVYLTSDIDNTIYRVGQ
jgi:glucose/arabinose dehydrogenase